MTDPNGKEYDFYSEGDSASIDREGVSVLDVFEIAKHKALTKVRYNKAETNSFLVENDIADKRIKYKFDVETGQDLIGPVLSRSYDDDIRVISNLDECAEEYGLDEMRESFEDALNSFMDYSVQNEDSMEVRSVPGEVPSCSGAVAHGGDFRMNANYNSGSDPHFTPSLEVDLTIFSDDIGRMKELYQRFAEDFSDL